jgi:hypothetical protein
MGIISLTVHDSTVEVPPLYPLDGDWSVALHTSIVKYELGIPEVTVDVTYVSEPPAIFLIM